MELRNSSDQNIPHVAARSGEDNLVKYFLKKVEFQMLINQKDNRGNTPLLAKTYDHPKVVHLFILDTRINLKVLNDRGMTALGISESTLETSASYHGVSLCYIYFYHIIDDDDFGYHNQGTSLFYLVC
ncbi:hypothetical protein L3X38_000120 [Prunus dulcis]|uniref:Ankyrin repeat family protein n=1 Tax=Prunus dulcis TaxID=3755 RepID=A0AAD4UT16_PRUDU|nr:hypothetical protein L3X38_000120 [Prunus dulcis]